MLRRCVALTLLALAGTALTETSARSAGLPGARAGGLRAPFAAQHPTRLGLSQRVPGAYGAIRQRPFVGPGSRPATRSVAHGLGRNLAPDLHARFVRRHHRGSIAGYAFPFTSEGYGDTPYYLGTPYDPAEAIPVYAPQIYSVPAEEQDAAPPSRRLMPRQTGLRDENQEACRSERVTVPETGGDGEREILVVRC